MRVTHVSHGYFSEDSVIGGAERYATDLALAMKAFANPRLLSFGPIRKSIQYEGLPIELFPAEPPRAGKMAYPATGEFTRALTQSDVLHVHHYHTRLTALCVVWGAMHGVPVFVTDCGGVEQPVAEDFDFEHLLTGLLPLSQFSKDQLAPHRNTRIIYGGVGDRFLQAEPVVREDKLVVCVARLMPHKGIDVLIRALEPDMRLELYGRPYRPDYLEELRRLAAGKQVKFMTDADDATVARAYRRATVTALVSVHEDMYGKKSKIPELLGLSLLEGMASGSPVIASNAGSLPEIVEEGVTGFVVPWGDVDALRKRLRDLCDDPELARRMGEAGQARVRERFTWDRVTERCLEAYREMGFNSQRSTSNAQLSSEDGKHSTFKRMEPIGS